jgi:hypothetical protein
MNIGDRVRILPRVEGQQSQFPHYAEYMRDYAGKTGIIVNVTTTRFIKPRVEVYNLKLDNMEYNLPYAWAENWLNPLDALEKELFEI